MAVHNAYAGGVDVMLVGGQGRHPAAQEDHVHAHAIAGQRRERVRRHHLTEPEVPLEEAAGRGRILDVERHRA